MPRWTPFFLTMTFIPRAQFTPHGALVSGSLSPGLKAWGMRSGKHGNKRIGIGFLKGGRHERDTLVRV